MMLESVEEYGKHNTHSVQPPPASAFVGSERGSIKSILRSHFSLPDLEEDNSMMIKGMPPPVDTKEPPVTWSTYMKPCL